MSAPQQCSSCGCQEIVISSDGIVNEAIEYGDADHYGIDFPDSHGYEFWEETMKNEEIEKNKIWNKLNPNVEPEKILSVDLHSPKYVKLWETFNPSKKTSNLNYKDLLGTYKLDSCFKDYRNNVSPIYKKILPDGTEAVLYKKKIGTSWQVKYHMLDLFKIKTIIFITNNCHFVN